MTDRRGFRCPQCDGSWLKQAVQLMSGGQPTTRRDREDQGLAVDPSRKTHSPDPTWYRCIICGADFDGTGSVYPTRPKWPSQGYL